jgi:phosphoglycolate phosphatase-like HAD superfamily hydrolase
MIPVPAGRKLIIFDLDGTLAIMPIDWQGMKRALVQAFPIVSFTPIADGLHEVARRYGDGGTARCFDVIREFEKQSVSGTVPVPDVIELIRAHGGTAAFAVCSNNLRATIHDVLHALGLSEYFSVLVGLDDVLEGKPAPEGLLRILGQLQASADEALFIGNRHTDAQAGASAGIETIIIAPCPVRGPLTDAGR